MSKPVVAQKAPYKVTVKGGKKYFWCACGLSSKQPFCDGSHKTTEFEPLSYEAAKDGDLYFCGCKQTAKTPLCDGTHNSI